MSKRGWLFCIWVTGFIVCLVLLFVFIVRGEAKMPDFPDYLSTLTIIYWPYLGSIIAFWASTDRKKSANPHSGSPFAIAATCSIVFNLVVIVLLGYVELEPQRIGLIEEAFKTVSRSAAILSVFTGPSVAYFFGKFSPAENEPLVASQQQ